ncbi:hypothetical protein GKN94_04495 [Candidatus Lucifugimonas marina]|uniref:Terminase small subunit n=1 Tax=Candidatus Lucifugimonas marina TaxID=3038979 RepID=A0AAJ5ZCY7_9CHLR|nr:hypothetical protein [SAR202 cluster bacterium JH702]MDG0868340.1 hypothetical protein [SAR202 cluster bacterium JH639]WFG34976.1 hypothetical protein GKN94_04495 [SAR202 cluster bacterium JH545]WFG38934.1 hypothetical protein GKO48_04660 [SAR202 cluster bacterium JH1073]
MLQTKRQTFAREFLVDRNATKAAIRMDYGSWQRTRSRRLLG